MEDINQTAPLDVASDTYRTNLLAWIKRIDPKGNKFTFLSYALITEFIGKQLYNTTDHQSWGAHESTLDDRDNSYFEQKVLFQISVDMLSALRKGIDENITFDMEFDFKSGNVVSIEVSGRGHEIDDDNFYSVIKEKLPPGTEVEEKVTWEEALERLAILQELRNDPFFLFRTCFNVPPVADLENAGRKQLQFLCRTAETIDLPPRVSNALRLRFGYVPYIWEIIPEVSNQCIRIRNMGPKSQTQVVDVFKRDGNLDLYSVPADLMEEAKRCCPSKNPYQ